MPANAQHQIESPPPANPLTARANHSQTAIETRMDTPMKKEIAKIRSFTRRVITFWQDIGTSEAEGRLVTGRPLWKRALDFSIILLLAPALVLLGGVVALVVGCGSCGPILFRPPRGCYKGRG